MAGTSKTSPPGFPTVSPRTTRVSGLIAFRQPAWPRALTQRGATPTRVTGSGCWAACSASVSGCRTLSSTTMLPLLCGPAAIGHQGGALHVRGGVGGQEQGEARDLLDGGELDLRLLLADRELACPLD